MSFISSFDITSIVLLCEAEDEGWWRKAEEEEWRPDPKMFYVFLHLVVNCNGIKMILANG